MRVLGLIPARGGSKGIPRKNLAPLAGRPLLAYSCEAALASRRLSRILLSTDDDEIAAVARRYGIEVPFLRPAELSTDETPMAEVARHALELLPRVAGFDAEAVAVLQPTSPLRGPEHIDAAVEQLEATGADTVVSVVRVPHAFEPGSLMRRETNGRLVPLAEGPLRLRRQDKPVLFARNGPAVLLARSEVVLRGSLYGPDVRGFEMSAEESVDVDSAADLAFAEFLMARRGR